MINVSPIAATKAFKRSVTTMLVPETQDPDYVSHLTAPPPGRINPTPSTDAHGAEDSPPMGLLASGYLSLLDFALLAFFQRHTGIFGGT